MPPRRHALQRSTVFTDFLRERDSSICRIGAPSVRGGDLVLRVIVSQENGHTVGSILRRLHENIFRRRELLSRSVPEPAHVRSHSGPGSASVLYGCPTCFDYVVRPAEFRTIILERLHLPLQMTEATCECGGVLDQKGKHRASCPRSGRLKRRALPTERAVARICREAGATVRANVFCII